MTREVIIRLVANIETREQRRENYSAMKLPPEHPRASSTDDAEGIISLFHEILGPIFDIKEFFDEFPKILNEFVKRIDPDCPFYYWTGCHTRFQDFPLPSFNEPSKSVILSRRGDPGIFVANRASLPQRGQLTVCANFHRVQ